MQRQLRNFCDDDPEDERQLSISNDIKIWDTVHLLSVLYEAVSKITAGWAIVWLDDSEGAFTPPDFHKVFRPKKARYFKNTYAKGDG